jgi:hypothetical protein
MSTKLDKLAEEYAEKKWAEFNTGIPVSTHPKTFMIQAYRAAYQAALDSDEVRGLVEALEFIANDLDLVGITPTEISHMAKANNAIKAFKAARGEYSLSGIKQK